jgi:hypothetical protein
MPVSLPNGFYVSSSKIVQMQLTLLVDNIELLLPSAGDTSQRLLLLSAVVPVSFQTTQPAHQRRGNPVRKLGSDTMGYPPVSSPIHTTLDTAYDPRGSLPKHTASHLQVKAPSSVQTRRQCPCGPAQVVGTCQRSGGCVRGLPGAHCSSGCGAASRNCPARRTGDRRPVELNRSELAVPLCSRKILTLTGVHGKQDTLTASTGGGVCIGPQ